MIVYHLSAVDLGRAPLLHPRIPRDRMPFENRSIKRICVAPAATGCLKALSGCFYNRDSWWHYAADVPEEMLFEPVGVPDAGETGEVWLLEPMEFYRA